ncbi:AraC family transcriptional regulator [Lysobacter sp. CA199]|uniref:AraC family transcriptional regulator n=1 Tax=Lysobacter sp. CA199 TaxID=3455608 RepID=UPI003F8D3435
MLLALVELCGELGVAPVHLCAGLGFRSEDLASGMLLSLRQAWRMIRRALQLTGRADLGLELGLRENLSHFGLPGFAMSAARTFGEAAEIGLHYQDQTGGITQTELRVRNGLAEFVVRSRLHDDGVLPFLVEEAFASDLAIMRILTGAQVRALSLELMYPAPAHAWRYQELFSCPVHFEAKRNAMAIESRWLDAPVATHSPVMVLQLCGLLERCRQEQAVPVAKAAVERVLARSGNATLSLEEVARTLALSVRTLRRRLHESGTSFRSISDHARAQAAQQLLREQGSTVAETSERLGFSDVRAFRRAFKRWLGRAPGDQLPGTDKKK